MIILILKDFFIFLQYILHLKWIISYDNFNLLRNNLVMTVVGVAGRKGVGGAQQTLLLFTLFIFFHSSSSNCASWATATAVLLLTFSSLKNTFKEFVGVCRTYCHAVW